MNPNKVLKFALAGVVVLFVLSVGWNFRNNEYLADRELQLKREQTKLLEVRDSIQAVIKRKDGQLLKAMRESAEADMIAEQAVQEAQKYKSKYDKIAFRATRNDRGA